VRNVKFSLKNRPKIGNIPKGKGYIEAYEEWFEGFEKELHEKLKQYSHPTAFPEKRFWENIAIRSIIKEILGE